MKGLNFEFFCNFASVCVSAYAAMEQQQGLKWNDVSKMIGGKCHSLETNVITQSRSELARPDWRQKVGGGSHMIGTPSSSSSR